MNKSLNITQYKPHKIRLILDKIGYLKIKLKIKNNFEVSQKQVLIWEPKLE